MKPLWISIYIFSHFSCMIFAQSPAEDAAIDRKIGILDRPWSFAWNPYGTFTFYQQRIGVNTGGQPFEQQVERALTSPASLIKSLQPAPIALPPKQSSKPKVVTPPVVITPPVVVSPNQAPNQNPNSPPNQNPNQN
ncbi:hypothetical protein P3T73_08450 [Kiritimatiellota bacterium B12222]|nr:hypothetical protein P3T73_08450 [Kiritimatiellota bacterium B12222]